MRIPAFRVAIIVYVVVGQALPAMAQVDRQRAEAYFKEVQALCERDGGRLWGVPLCGPMVIADLRTRRTLPAGDGWTFKAAPGWAVREGARPGDYKVVRQQP